jgi:hypothetical protein
MKYLMFICLFTVSCAHCHDTTPCCKYNTTVEYCSCQEEIIVGPICRNGDYEDRSARKAMIQQSSPYPTLRVIGDNGRPMAIILNDRDLDALECSLNQYRRNYGYSSRNRCGGCR